MKLKNSILPSILRTVVPILYALLINWGVVQWFGDGVSKELWLDFLTLIVTALVYVILRVAERYRAAVGWLLGFPSQPSYGEVPPNPPETPYADPSEVAGPPAG